jgi:diguanylate cyclase (GGDEF)-like protein
MHVGQMNYDQARFRHKSAKEAPEPMASKQTPAFPSGSSSRSGSGLRGQWRTAFFATVLTLLVAVGGTVLAFSQVVSRYRTAARHLDRAVTLSSQLTLDITEHEGLAHRLWQGGKVDRVEFIAQQHTIEALFDKAIGELSMPSGKILMDHAGQTWRKVLQDRGLWGDNVVVTPGTTPVMQDRFSRDVEEVYQALGKVSQIALADGSHDLDTADSTQNVVVGMLATVFSLIVGILTYFSMRVTRDIVQPLESLRASALRLRDGEFDHRVVIPERQRHTEVGELAEMFNSMANSLSTNHQDLQHRATYDSLTGLANRAHFQKEIDGFFAPGSVRGSDGLTVLFIDLDDFKKVNDVHGHSVGDQLLMGAARRLLSCVRSDDLLARFGGDEFAILVSNRDSADRIAERVLMKFGKPFDVGGSSIPVAVSIGISTATRETTAAERLMAEADHALYSAKRAGKNRLQAFDPVEQSLVLSSSGVG